MTIETIVPPKIAENLVSLASWPAAAACIVQGIGKSQCDDRIDIEVANNACLALIADGATGAGFGGQAADIFIAELKRLDPRTVTTQQLEDAFHRAGYAIRAQLPDGDTTGIALVIRDGKLRGCSIGDSEAFLVYPNGRDLPLTAAQVQKPRIGTGRAQPRSFGPIALETGARILAFTDGVFFLEPHRQLIARAATADIGAFIQTLAERALGFGEPSDDCSAFLIDCDRL